VFLDLHQLSISSLPGALEIFTHPNFSFFLQFPSLPFWLAAGIKIFGLYIDFSFRFCHPGPYDTFADFCEMRPIFHSSVFCMAKVAFSFPAIHLCLSMFFWSEFPFKAFPPLPPLRYYLAILRRRPSSFVMLQIWHVSLRSLFLYEALLSPTLFLSFCPTLVPPQRVDYQDLSKDPLPTP